ncbi:DUF3757 domain-containing protein [Pseudomonas fluorescens]|uniref:DUF3757 domain-containing protein n=1 Tax=Pseudomonas fluorescens TaxID=294 RepID=A0A5E7CSE6_PSEFL|nr:DUF3757 domain-containing protein [Pseudomonas fluorescens]VVO02665.1 hypothetical protein PS723_02767 [Pseudomonas fluorescens]
MRMKLIASLFTTMAMAGNVYAATTTCPEVADIKQLKDESDGGYLYSAPGPGKFIWVGSNPYAEEDHLKTFKFTGALYRDISSEGNSFVVSCDYEGEEWFAFARLTLYSFKDWKPAPDTRWTVAEKNAPIAYRKTKQVQTCESGAEQKCAFEYSSLTPVRDTK